MSGEGGDHRAYSLGGLEPQPVVADVLDRDAGKRRHRRCRAVEGDLDGLAAQMPQLGQGALVDEPSVPQDAHPIAERFDFAQDVRREQDRLATGLGLLGAVTEFHLHQWVEAAGRLVEDQQIGPGGQRGNQLNLLPVSLRQRADFLARIEFEAGDQLVAICLIDTTVQPGEEM